ncbi:MAG: nucleoside 2-deoxyribosyltransferase [Paludibacteraceae bacterium]|nr:nucleoside 2-deoxyribosyltransferase [Paludibacteraceae bacterium]
MTLPSSTQKEYKMRLGGIVHAARGLWALGIDYAVAYFAPAYIDGQIESYLHEIGCREIHKIGNVTGCPYTMLIREAKEIGDQGYEFLYRDCIKIEYFIEEINRLADYGELMCISGNYDMDIVFAGTRPDQPIHIDVANNIRTIDQLSKGRRFGTLFVSTSSDLFRGIFNNNIDDFYARLSAYADKIVLKENRGGSRALDVQSGQKYQISSQTSSVMHSVGVGDVYDVVAVSANYPKFEDKLCLASWIAMLYAKTTFLDDFKHSAEGVLKIPICKLKALEGCVLPWERREYCNIYIAAPDFDFLDTRPIDVLCASLSYHNFVPRRPVKELGQMPVGAEKSERLKLFYGDMALMEECNMLVAVLLNNDPGTLIEIGIARQRGMPTIVYDPYGIANNCMLTEWPTLLSSNLDEVIAKVFDEYSKRYKNGTL